MFERACLVSAAIICGLGLLMAALPFFDRQEVLVRYLAFRQDLPIVPMLLFGLLLAPRFVAPVVSLRRPTSLRVFAISSCIVLLLFGWAGHDLVFSGYDLSRDEQMASFDAAIFRHGMLFFPLPTGWRPFAEALNLRFILPIGAREFWVSAYLPGNAAFRAAMGLIADPAIASPLLTALGLFCLWRIAVRLWPHSPAAQLACILLYIGSSQVVVTSMTAFAMSMHLALNLLWLWLFLLDRPRTHAAAILIGWVATGIHQPLFHPLFVLPFLGMLALDRRWKLLTLYLLAYAAIASLWLAWPVLVSTHGTAAAIVLPSATPVGFADRLHQMVSGTGLNDPWMAVPNLLRMLCWQHPLLLPLALLGLWTSWRGDRLCQALAIGFVLPVIIVGVLIPWQGHGWGYRYVHQVLGNAILLGGFGAQALEQRGCDARRALLATTGAALLILLPIHAAMAHRLVAPFVQVHRSMLASGADIVLLDTEATPYAEDVVFNDPTLATRPKLLIAKYVRPADLPRLCSMGSLEFFPGARIAPIAKLWGRDVPQATPAFLRLEAAARQAGCRIKNF